MFERKTKYSEVFGLITMHLSKRGRNNKANGSFSFYFREPTLIRIAKQLFFGALILCAFLSPIFAQIRFEDRRIANIDIVFEGVDRNIAAAEQFRETVADVLGGTYTTVGIRDSIERLHATRRVVAVTVEAAESGPDAVSLRYIIRRTTQAETVRVEVGNTVGDDVTEQELLFKLNLLSPGTAITEQTLRNNADLILEYLRERGFFKAEVAYEQRPVEGQNQVGVLFRVNPNEQAKVESFRINIEGFDPAKFAGELKLPGELFTREKLNQDVEKIREVLRDEDYLAPELSEPRVIYEGESNTVSIELSGRVGPKVKVSVDSEEAGVGEGTQRRLLPIKREGTLDYAAIVEGERRLENHYQERGYFFVNVTPVCSVQPAFTEGEASSVNNNTESLCSALSGAELMNREVDVTYQVALNRKLRLTDIRLQGTDEMTIEDIQTVLESQESNFLGIVPLFGYGRGYTSARILEEDANTIRSLMRELGFRDATVRVNQGVSPTGDDLIITFVVEEGMPTVINAVEIAGNSAIPTDTLLAQLPSLVGENYSRAKIRNAERKLSEFYSERGYYDARITSTFDEGPVDPTTQEKLAKIRFNIENEDKPVIIDRVLVTGNDDTKPEAILKAVTLKPGELLKRTDIYTSEQNLYGTDAFSRVDIKEETSGTNPDGSRRTDVIVNVEEQPPRLIQYGGGFSTDLGLSGFFDIRHFNLLGRLWQGGARISWSQRQQLVQLDYINPRFIRDGEKRFAPLTLRAQYQRDSTVTRFFRSAFDKGTFGIVQRVDEEGRPIDQFGAPAGDPTINRLTFTAETNRTIDLKKRSILFFRYRYEDVRLYNIESLLIKDLLRPDSKTRISGFGATFVRDTRENCAIKYTLLDIIARGEAGPSCRYSASDPTRGQYLTAEYNVSLPMLGANIGFHKFQASYNVYYSFPRLKNMTLAGRAILGLASVFSDGDRFGTGEFAELNGILPISERFFAGGANTLRGFDFEEAGPRVAVVPQGTFRNSSGEPVFLDPFTIPFGGNALAVVNLEARIPLSNSIRAVPFYDGGNVFRRVGDIFNPPDVPPDDVLRQNLRALWSHTVGVGLRVKTPIGGELGVDYGYLLNPPTFLIPQMNGPNAFYRLPQSQIHFRFSQAF